MLDHEMRDYSHRDSWNKFCLLGQPHQQQNVASRQLNTYQLPVVQFSHLAEPYFELRFLKNNQIVKPFGKRKYWFL